ncbi:hypothetical protein BwSH20_07000 [Bradyrhizobium ottawaense]|jgi:hypothetical protein|nr:hypothetical protein SG09_30670 [Bradyrhizobium ottawaense]GMO17334.1 hypothetical protein BwSH14_07820 [Bradyrhizobium ottawaense]GMO30092.1 hypothetical protein BwSF12_28040 [Bradyrhizobium ottawaense]GMO35992.1 hypothetical protein BwSF21_43140 [Bradyrhizobium ottawaense]GMO67029.1 hypothetical protein BwSG20_28310 [Bradyrhizobium ottawaense]
MSSEKEPAGAFNKAQRLMESSRYKGLSGFCKERRRLVVAEQFWVFPVEAVSRVSADLQASRCRLTALHDNGHVDLTKLLRRDRQDRLVRSRDECRRYYPQKSQ